MVSVYPIFDSSRCSALCLKYPEKLFWAFKIAFLIDLSFPATLVTNSSFLTLESNHSKNFGATFSAVSGAARYNRINSANPSWVISLS